MSSEERQRALAAMVQDPALEARARSDPEAAARELGVSIETVRALVRIEPARWAAFRRSQAHKDGLRAGKPAQKSGW